MRTSAPIKVMVHCPKTGEGRQELARRVADAHGDFVIDAIHKLNCPPRQKLELLQGVMDTAGVSCKSEVPGGRGDKGNR